jgi:MFS family permease
LGAQSVGLEVMLVPAVFVIMNIVYALSAYPAGVISDTGGRVRPLIIGLGVLILADLLLAFAPGKLVGVFAGVALWGLHMGFTQGQLSALVADAAPEDMRGTAFGVFNLVSGVVMLAASVIAGELWTASGPMSTFLAGAGFAGLALLSLLVRRRPGTA